MTRDRAIALGLLGFALAFNLFYLRWQVAVAVPDLNDNVLHLAAVQQAADAVRQGQDVADNWLPGIAMGYPLTHHYQHLPTVFLALLHVVFGGVASAAGLLHWVSYILLSLFPLSIYWAMRKLGFERVPSALAGLVAPLLSTNLLYGLEYGSYVWAGSGLYTQLWGMLLLPPALAYSYAALKNGRGYLPAVLLLSATALSHLVLGYIAALSVALFAFLTWDRREIWRRLLRLLLIGVSTAAVTSYFLVPFLLDSGYLNRSVWELPEKYASYGYQAVLSGLVTGQLLDHGRLPVLTILAAVGLAFCLWPRPDAVLSLSKEPVEGRREERRRLLVVTFVFWLLLYFGRPTWGALLDLLPLGRDLHLHRLIVGLHLPAILIAGLGLWAITRWLWNRGGPWLLAALGLTALLLAPAYLERQQYLRNNGQWLKGSEAAFLAEQQDLDDLVAALRSLPPGRVYAGLPGNWGNDYRIGSVPMYAYLQTSGFDMLGYLYHALSLNGDLQVHFNEADPGHYDLWNVRYMVSPADRSFPMSFTVPVAQFGRHSLYAVTTLRQAQGGASGYFDLVDSGIALTGDKGQWYRANLGWLQTELPYRHQHPSEFFGAVRGNYAASYPMTDVPWQAVPPGDATPRGQVLAERVAAGAYAADIQVARPSYLLLKVTYHPRWQARLDGQRVQPVMLAPSYLGVPVPPGEHSVSFQYVPGPARLPLVLLGMAALALLGILDSRRRWLAPVARPLGRLGGALEHRLARWQPSPDLPYLGGVLAFALLAGLPLFQLLLTSGHDAFEYPPRLVEFYQGLSYGQALPRWAPDLSGGYGQPFFNFNPPLFYYLGSLFRFVGLGYIAAGNAALFSLLALSGVAMYLFARELLGRPGGLAAAAAYMLAPYFLVDLYVRHAASEFSSFPFIPLVMWGLYRFSRDSSRRFLALGALSLALLMLTSNPAALIAFPMLLAYAVFLSVTRRSAWVLLRAAAVLGLGLMLSAFFWLPSLAEKDFVKTGELLRGYLSYANHFVYPQQLLFSLWGYGLSLPGPNDGMSFQLGAVHVALLGLSALALVRLGRSLPHARAHLWFFWAALAVAAFFATTASAPLWRWLPLLQYLEFPWRILILTTLALAFISGFCLLTVTGRRARRLLLAGVLLALFLVNFPLARPERFHDWNEADFSPRAIAELNLSVTAANEYEPVWASATPPVVSGKLSLLDGEASVIDQKLFPARYEFWIEAGTGSRLRLNTFYFPGWRLWVDGQEHPIDYSNDYGVMDFDVEAGRHHVAAAFTDTPVRKLGNGLALAGAGLLLAGVLLPRRVWRSR